MYFDKMLKQTMFFITLEFNSAVYTNGEIKTEGISYSEYKYLAGHYQKHCWDGMSLWVTRALGGQWRKMEQCQRSEF